MYFLIINKAGKCYSPEGLCNYAHSLEELKAKGALTTKTKMCQNFSLHGFCPYGTMCFFAHDAKELRKIERPFKV